MENRHRKKRQIIEIVKEKAVCLLKQIFGIENIRFLLTCYSSSAPDKRGYQENIFLISARKRTLWYSLEVPQ